MNDFPLAPFLISLASDGISIAPDDYERLTLVLRTRGAWNRRQLRGVLAALLTHTPEQTGVFKQRFDAFFAENLPLAESIGEEHIRRAFEDLQRIKSGEFGGAPSEWSHDDPTPPDPATGGAETLPPDREKEAKKKEPSKSHLLKLWEIYRSRVKSMYALAAIAVVLLPAMIVQSTRWLKNNSGTVFTGTSANTANQNVDPTVKNPTTSLGSSNQNRPENTPTPTATQTVGGGGTGGNKTGPAAQSGGNGSDQFDVGQLFLVIVGVAGTLVTVSLILRLQMKERPAPNPASSEPFTFDPEAPDHFPLKKIGGSPSHHLDATMLDQMSRGLDYFLSENACKRLDIKASVHASGRNAGMYTPLFYRLKRLLSVYILEDAYAEPSAWNPVARELAAGLRRRGVSVRYGNFYGSLESFQMEDGGALSFEELEGEQNEALILFFSDGKGLTRGRDGFLLEALGRWGAVAWLDMREKKFWDESAHLIKRFGIPLYQANKVGSERALKRLVSEHDSKRHGPGEATGWKGTWPNNGRLLNAHIEVLLGNDAVKWAHACSMIQPLSLGMADTLRRKFAPHLSPERVEGLFRLPGSRWNASGLHFSAPVVAALREGFTKSWNVQQQEEILAFITEQIRDREPQEKDSLRYLTWRWVLERVRLEIEPDSALEVMVKLAETPLGDRIKKDFSLLYLPGEVVLGRDSICLRLRPKTALGLLYFQRLSGREVSVSGLSFVEWLKMLWYKALQALDVVRSTEIQFTLEKIRDLLSSGRSSAQNRQLVASPSAVNDLFHGRPTSILKVNNLHTYFTSEEGDMKAADGVGFDVAAGEVLALVGESGCGKSVTALSIMRLISSPGEIVGGEVWFGDENLLDIGEKQMRKIRGNRIAMIFQDPMTCLNPFQTVGRQVAESFSLHRKLSRQQAHEAVVKALREVAIPDPEARANEYPHQFSGGMRQRVMLAMALACDPDILIADEPTTALDLATQAQIMELLKELKANRKLAVLLITHDLGLVAGIADRVCVMYTGKVVEEGSVQDVFNHPRHPYTQGLISSMVELTKDGAGRREVLPAIEGAVPPLTQLPPGCHFAPRCLHRMERCTQEPIPLYQIGSMTRVRCVLYEQQSVRIS